MKWLCHILEYFLRWFGAIAYDLQIMLNITQPQTYKFNANVWLNKWITCWATSWIITQLG